MHCNQASQAVKPSVVWRIDYITLPQTCQGKCHVLTMVEATTGWLETMAPCHCLEHYLGLEKQVLWRHGTPERTESDNGTHFQNYFVDTWAKEHGTEWTFPTQTDMPVCRCAATAVCRADCGGCRCARQPCGTLRSATCAPAGESLWRQKRRGCLAPPHPKKPDMIISFQRPEVASVDRLCAVQSSCFKTCHMTRGKRLESEDILQRTALEKKEQQHAMPTSRLNFTPNFSTSSP
ncbi:hypothetical protein QYF61_004808 [Mycteria americana]|uniref:Integrase catalytic domain-containing protein n=1 Tax=Mycteria americana TaxID=33587 RepID=A0AAN7MT83_MYCAM|nr:hypothetical protein QYF61_004808 [Mycteria americana]